MRYLFNLFVSERDYEIEFQESIYTLSGVNHMGDIDFLVYRREGAESLLTTSTFLLQYQEAAEKLLPLRRIKSLTAIRIRLNNLFPGHVTENGSGEGDAAEYEYQIRYKDVDVRAVFSQGRFRLQPNFHIYSEKLIDARRAIPLEDVKEFRPYFDPQD